MLLFKLQKETWTLSTLWFVCVCSLSIKKWFNFKQTIIIGLLFQNIYNYNHVYGKKRITTSGAPATGLTCNVLTTRAPVLRSGQVNDHFMRTMTAVLLKSLWHWEALNWNVWSLHVKFDESTYRSTDTNKYCRRIIYLAMFSFNLKLHYNMKN